MDLKYFADAQADKGGIKMVLPIRLAYEFHKKRKEAKKKKSKKPDPRKKLLSSNYRGTLKPIHKKPDPFGKKRRKKATTKKRARPAGKMGKMGKPSFGKMSKGMGGLAGRLLGKPRAGSRGTTKRGTQSTPARRKRRTRSY